MITNMNFRQCPAGSVPYTIRAGDTLGKIAWTYNSSVQDIIGANPGITPTNLTIGQDICVPLKIQPYPSCPTTNYYVVKEGDTMESIAGYFNITVQQLMFSNYGIGAEDLYVDQVICIPVAPSPVNVEVIVEARTLVVYRNGNELASYTIAVENPDLPVPRGTFSVINKNVDPGVEGGSRWLGLSEADFGIRGINSSEFVDAYSTGNSLVLSNSDVSELFNLVPVGTSVRVR